MPIYEYACEKCEHEFEREQRITDDPVKTCPNCRSRKVKKLISRTSFVLKGGGWYADAYSSTPNKDSADKSDSASSSSSDSSASDSKPKSKTKADSKSDSKSKSKAKSGSKKNAA
jgi:putative FmdB family regulatory protein